MRRNQISTFARNGPVHLNRPVKGALVQSTAGQPRCARASAVVMLDTPCSEVVWRVLATHCIRPFSTFTSPPVRHRVSSHFNWTLLIHTLLFIQSPSPPQQRGMAWNDTRWLHSFIRQAHCGCSGILSLNTSSNQKKSVIVKCEERKNQKDATIRCLLLTSVSTCFGHHYVHLQENKGPVTAFGVMFW